MEAERLRRVQSRMLRKTQGACAKDDFVYISSVAPNLSASNIVRGKGFSGASIVHITIILYSLENNRSSLLERYTHK